MILNRLLGSSVFYFPSDKKILWTPCLPQTYLNGLKKRKKKKQHFELSDLTLSFQLGREGIYMILL